MQNISKIMLGTLVMLSLSACSEKSETSATPVAAVAPEPADVVMAASLVPVAAGVTELDLQKLAKVTAGKAPCQLDFVAKQSVATQPANVKVGQQVVFQGWIGNPSLQAPDAFAIVLSGAQAYAIRGNAGADRPDVAKVLKAEGLAKSGYNVGVKLDGVVPGEYAISFIQEAGAGTIQCLSTAKVVVAAN